MVGGGDDAWLDAYVTDFLTRAREKGFAVPDILFKSALDRIRNSVVNANEPEKDGGRDLAYGLYVLARNGAAPIGDLRYLADTKLNNLATPIAKAQLAAALALVGDRNRAERVYAAAVESLAPKPVLEFGRNDYGSALRDAAALVSLASEGNAPRATLTQAVARVEVARGLTSYTSTQENAWMVLAARALAKETLALDLNGQSVKTALFRSYKAGEVANQPIKITNTGDVPLQAVVSVSGSPVMPEPAASNGFKIERNYFTLDGKPADISKATQNDRFAVVLKVTEPKPEYGHIMVSDYLPAGLEIDNPRLVSSGDTGTLDWIEDGQEPEHTEFRDDRFTAAIDRATDSKAVFTVAYVVRAVIARQIRAAAGLCRGHVQSLALRPHRHRQYGGRRGEMSEVASDSTSRQCFRLGADQEGGDRVGRRRPRSDRRVRYLGRLARPIASRSGPRSLHHRRRSQRQAVARLCDGRRPLAAARRCQEGRRPRLPQLAAGL